MLKGATTSITKKFQKQQILTVITKKYMELLHFFDTILIDNIDIKTIINMTEIIKKSNPVIIQRLWYDFMTKNFSEQISQVEKGDFEFWLNNDFNPLIDAMAKEIKWNILGKGIISKTQTKIKNECHKNADLNSITNNLFKVGLEIDKLVKMYASL